MDQHKKVEFNTNHIKLLLNDIKLLLVIILGEIDVCDKVSF